jgi:hypothetical protein
MNSEHPLPGVKTLAVSIPETARITFFVARQLGDFEHG